MCWTCPIASRKPVVLVVEDEALVRMFLVDQLQDLGFDVIEAGNASEGLARRARPSSSWTLRSSIAACRIVTAWM